VLGIETAFITIPGHIYAAFDTGLKSGEPKAEDPFYPFLAASSRFLIEQGGKLWMPVEITAAPRDFTEALRIGAREWRQNAGAPDGNTPGTRALYPTRESWALYPPVSVPGAGNNLPSMPEEGEITRRFREITTRLLRGD
jgi:hypothetical protein